jgi:hypothetical protein
MACVYLRDYLKAIVYGLRAGLPSDLPTNIYSRTVITPNYWHLGFVRRGLGGSIASLLSSDFVISGQLFDLVSIALLVSALVVLVRRVVQSNGLVSALYLAAVIALSPQTFLGWSRDPVRTDLLVLGFIAWAYIATLNRHRTLGVMLILVGSLAHETALIFGVPLLFVVNARALLDREISAFTAAKLLAIPFVGLAIIVWAEGRWSAPGLVIAQYMLNASPTPADDLGKIAKEIAAYMMVAGFRGVRTSICWNLDYNPQYAVDAIFAVVTLGAYVLILGLRRQLLGFTLAALLPMLLMIAIAMDTGRWLKMAVLNSWLLAVYWQTRVSSAESLGRWTPAAGAVLVVVLLAMGWTPYDHINAKSHGIEVKLGFHDPGSLEGWLDHCDPEWRRFIRAR